MVTRISFALENRLAKFRMGYQFRWLVPASSSCFRPGDIARQVPYLGQDISIGLCRKFPPGIVDQRSLSLIPGTVPLLLFPNGCVDCQ